MNTNEIVGGDLHIDVGVIAALDDQRADAEGGEKGYVGAVCCYSKSSEEVIIKNTIIIVNSLAAKLMTIGIA